MKDAEDEAFDDLAKRQGSWGGGFPAKRAMAAAKLQDGKCKYCVDGCIACDARAQKEALYGMNQDDWKDVVAAITKVRDGRGIYLGCRPADVFKDWFLALGTAKVKEKNND